MEIKSLSKIHFDTLYKAFNSAFADYDVHVNQDELQRMLKRRGFDPDVSFAAFDKQEIIAFTLTGIGNFNGIPTAYDTGTGTLQAYRRQGLATKIFEHSLPFLQARHIRQYLLEVLQHNTKAFSVYRNLGFEISREFNYHIQKNEAIHPIALTNDTLPYSIRHIDMPEIETISDFWDFYPSWQNSVEAIKRALTDFVIVGAFTEEKLMGYCVFDPVSGDITQIAVNKQHRRKGIAGLLLAEVIKLNKHNRIKVVNTDIQCHSINNFLIAKNILLTGKQFEMIKKLKEE